MADPLTDDEALQARLDHLHSRWAELTAQADEIWSEISALRKEQDRRTAK